MTLRFHRAVMAAARTPRLTPPRGLTGHGRQREKQRQRGEERPVTGRCVACSEGHCWSYERTMHCPRPKYSPYQLTSHNQHCSPVTIPTGLAQTHSLTTSIISSVLQGKKTVCISLWIRKGSQVGGQRGMTKDFKPRHAWAHILSCFGPWTCVCVCAHIRVCFTVKFRRAHPFASLHVTFLLAFFCYSLLKSSNTSFMPFYYCRTFNKCSYRGGWRSFHCISAPT